MEAVLDAAAVPPDRKDGFCFTWKAAGDGRAWPHKGRVPARFYFQAFLSGEFGYGREEEGCHYERHDFRN